MIKLLSDSHIPIALKGFETLTKKQQKDSKPYISSIQASAAKGYIKLICLNEADIGTEFSIDYNSGQTYMANSRIYVQETVAEKFKAAFKKLVTSRKMGDPSQKNVNHGPQADKAQYETVRKYIELGKQSGKLELEGPVKTGDSLMVHPVIFTDQPEDSRIAS